MDVDDALGMALGDGDWIAAGKGHMARVQQQADRGPGVLHEAVDILGALDDGSHVVVEGHAHALGQHVIGDLGEALSQALPLRRRGDLRPAGGGGAHIEDDLAARLGKHHHRRSQARQQLQVIRHGGDLGLGIARQELGAVPARDEG